MTVVEKDTNRRVASTALAAEIRDETFAPDVVVAARNAQREGVEDGVRGGVHTGAKIASATTASGTRNHAATVRNVVSRGGKDS